MSKSKSKSNQMTREAVRRITQNETKANDGKILPAGFTTRVDRVLQRREAAGADAQTQKH